MNWYKIAKLELRLRRDAGLKEGIIATLLSILSGISLPYEAQAIKKFLDQKHIEPRQQQEIVSTVNQLTYQNKNLFDLNINDINLALKNAGSVNKYDNLFDPNRPEIQPQILELNIDEVKNSIKKHEGKNRNWGFRYLDPSRKNYNIGYGFNLNKANAPAIIKSIGADYRAVKSGRQSLSEEQIEMLLDISITESIAAAKSFVPNYSQLPSKAKLVLVDMAFMGQGNIHTFDNMKSALIYGDYDRAADEMIDSLWAKQVGNRAFELADIMRSIAII